MKYSENETTIRWDYAGNKVHIYTTRQGEKRNIISRLGEENVDVDITHEKDGKEIAWNIILDSEICRNPYYVAKILNKD